MTAPGGEPEKGHGLILLGLVLGILLSALDQTVVGTSLPRIVAELGGLERFSWLFTAYMLASTVVIPLAGKMADRLGRRPVFLAGMGIFLLGSMLCGLAQDLDQLIVFRFVQGLGGGIIFPVAFVVVADLYPPNERGRIQGALSAVWGVASIVGPLLGGFIVDHASWRWVFYVNVPVGLLAIAVTATHFPRVAPRREQPLDVAGAGLLTVALTALLLAVLWGGAEHPWGSPIIVGLAALGALTALAFVVVERRAPDPVLPLGILREPVAARSLLAALLVSVGMFAVISFLPLFLQGVLAQSATASGLALVPMTLLIVAGSAGSGRAMRRWGYKPFILVGPALALAGLALLATLTAASPVAHAVASSVVVGLGLGFTFPTYMVAVQNVVPLRTLGSATASVTLVRTLGAAAGVAVLGALFNARMAEELPRRVPPESLGALAGLTPQQLAEALLRQGASLPPGVAQGVREALAASLAPLFVAAAAAVAVGLAVSLAIRAVPLKDRAAMQAQAAAEGLPAAPRAHSRP